MISFACPTCATKINARDNFAGKGSKCPKCGEAIRVPSLLAEKAEQRATSLSATQPVAASRADLQAPLSSGSSGFIHRPPKSPLLTIVAALVCAVLLIGASVGGYFLLNREHLAESGPKNERAANTEAAVTSTASAKGAAKTGEQARIPLFNEAMRDRLLRELVKAQQTKALVRWQKKWADGEKELRLRLKEEEAKLKELRDDLERKTPAEQRRFLAIVEARKGGKAISAEDEAFANRFKIYRDWKSRLDNDKHVAEDKAPLEEAKAEKVRMETQRELLSRVAADVLLGGEHEQAIADLSAAVRTDSEFIEGFTVRGSLLCLAKGHFAEAIEDCALASRVNQDDPWPHLVIALANAKTGNRQKAVAEYGKAMEMDPRMAEWEGLFR